MADLNFLNTTDCTAITFDTPTTGLQYNEYVLGSVVKDFTDVDKYTITYSNNCCSPGVTTDLAPRYQFVLTIDSCGAPSNQNTYKIDGINGNLVQTVEVSIDAGAFSSVTFNVIADELFIPPSFALPANPTIDKIFRITTLSGFIYEISFTVTQTSGVCDGSLSVPVITYPSVPTNIVASEGEYATSGLIAPALGVAFTITADVKGVAGNSIVITLDNINTIEQLVINWNATYPANTCSVVYTLGAAYISNTPPTVVLSGGVDVPTNSELSFNSLIGVDPILPGTYEIIFCEINEDDSSTCIQNHIFIDCGTLKCTVVNKLVLCLDSNIMDFYNALVWANDCTTTTTYAEICALYEILTIILESDGCFGKLDECNCSDATTIANKLSPLSYPTQTNSNPCTSC